MNLRRWLRSDALVLLFCVVFGGGLRLYNLLALDPFIDEVTWINQAVEHVYDQTDFTTNMPVFPRVVVASKFAGFPGPIHAAAQLVDDWQTQSTLWIPTALHARPPLFFWLILITTKLPGNPLIGGRLAAVLPDVASGCLLYLLTRQVYPRSMAFVVAFLWSVSPFGLFFSRIASDDPLLTVLSVATAYSACRVMRTTSRLWPVMLGLSLACSIYTKTLGVLNIGVPLFALAILVPRSAWPRKAFALVVSYLIATLAILPLVPWIPRLYGRASEFADVGSGAIDASSNTLTALLGLPLLSANVARVLQWAMDYFKPPFMLAAAVGCGLALFRRDRPSLFFLATFVVPSLALLNRAEILFTRYFMFAIYPAYVLAALGLVELGRSSLSLWERAGMRAALSRFAGPAVALGGLSLVTAAWLPLSHGILVSPAQAPLTIEDHLQYVEDWYALFGLSTVAELIRSRATPSGATVLEPARPWWYNPRMPEDALHYYLWDESRVHFVESPALLDAQNLCDLRPWMAASEPVFLVIDGADGPAGGTPPDVPAYTQRLEAALARDLPEALEVLRIPRPSAANWLSVVQINAAPARSAVPACRT